MERMNPEYSGCFPWVCSNFHEALGYASALSASKMNIRHEMRIRHLLESSRRRLCSSQNLALVVLSDFPRGTSTYFTWAEPTANNE